MCDPRFRVWEVSHPLDSKHVTPGTRSGRWGYLGDSGHVTQGPRSGEGSHQGDCGCVTTHTGSERVSP